MMNNLRCMECNDIIKNGKVHVQIIGQMRRATTIANVGHLVILCQTDAGLEKYADREVGRADWFSIHRVGQCFAP
jgi:hypothetical protein